MAWSASYFFLPFDEWGTIMLKITHLLNFHQSFRFFLIHLWIHGSTRRHKPQRTTTPFSRECTPDHNFRALLHAAHTIHPSVHGVFLLAGEYISETVKLNWWIVLSSENSTFSQSSSVHISYFLQKAILNLINIFVRSGFLAGFLAFKSASRSRLRIVRSLIFSSGGSCALIFFEEARGDFFAILRMLLSVCWLETLGLPRPFSGCIFVQRVLLTSSNAFLYCTSRNLQFFCLLHVDSIAGSEVYQPGREFPL